jgi:hypothetical protein
MLILCFNRTAGLPKFFFFNFQRFLCSIVFLKGTTWLFSSVFCSSSHQVRDRMSVLSGVWLSCISSRLSYCVFTFNYWKPAVIHSHFSNSDITTPENRETQQLNTLLGANYTCPLWSCAVSLWHQLHCITFCIIPYNGVRNTIQSRLMIAFRRL